MFNYNLVTLQNMPCMLYAYNNNSKRYFVFYYSFLSLVSNAKVGLYFILPREV